MGIKELKDHLSDVLARVETGETVTLTRHRKPVARLLPVDAIAPRDLLHALAEAGRLAWAGGKPLGADPAPDTSMSPVSDAVLQDRR